MGVVEVSLGRPCHFCLANGGDIVHDALRKFLPASVVEKTA